MEKKQKTTTFLHDVRWHVAAVLGVTIAIVVVYIVARVALTFHAQDVANDATQAILWKTIAGASEMVPWILAIVTLAMVAILVGEVRKLKVVSAVTQESQTVIIAPDDNQLHSVQISTGTHVGCIDQTGAPVRCIDQIRADLEVNPEEDSDLEILSLEDESLKTEKPKSESPESEKRKNLCLGKKWHHFWFKIRNAGKWWPTLMDYLHDLFSREDDDESIESWIDIEEDGSKIASITRTAAEQQKMREQLAPVNEKMIDLDNEVSGQQSLETEREQERQLLEEKLDKAQEKLQQKQSTPEQEPEMVSGNTGRIAASIDKVFSQPEDEVDQVLDEYTNEIGKSVKNMVKQVNPPETHIKNLRDGSMTSEEFYDTQTKMAQALEKDGFDPIPIEYTDLAPKFNFEEMELFQTIMKLHELFTKLGIKNREDLMRYLAKANLQMEEEFDEDPFDDGALNQLCLRHRVEIATVERAIIVNYPDQEGITLEMAVKIEDLSTKHRAIAHNLGLFPEELDDALAYLHVGIAEINTPEDIKTLWSVVSMAISSTGLRSGYDPSACVRSKTVNVADFVKKNGRTIKKSEPTSGAGKVFQFPGSCDDNSAVVGTGKIPQFSRWGTTPNGVYGNVRGPRW